MEIFGIPLSAMLSQLLLGLVNGSFYAILSLGLAIIFGLLNVINFAHGALFMLGAMLTWMGLSYFNLPYWVMLVLAPLIVGAFGILIERSMLRWLYKLDHLYGLLLTFGLTLVVEGVFRSIYGSSGQPYDVPDALSGATNLGFMFLPNYRAWVVLASLVVCFATWFVIEKTRLGAYLNELTDVIADTFLILPFARVPEINPSWIAGIIVLATISEMTGVLGMAVGGIRRYDGPMGKSDRAVVFSALAVWLGAGKTIPAQSLMLIPGAILILLALTICNRVRGGLAEVDSL